ncbi:hypothetical protein FB451DRAFT_80295 [Mycena latifolia]|nr:hypothetical protein FB451DRAFT_80295 [Mycena latifolia]
MTSSYSSNCSPMSAAVTNPRGPRTRGVNPMPCFSARRLAALSSKPSTRSTRPHQRPPPQFSRSCTPCATRAPVGIRAHGGPRLYPLSPIAQPKIRLEGRLRRTYLADELVIEDCPRVPVLPPPQLSPFLSHLTYSSCISLPRHLPPVVGVAAFSACDDLLDFTLPLPILVYLFGSKLIPFSKSVHSLLGIPASFTAAAFRPSSPSPAPVLCTAPGSFASAQQAEARRRLKIAPPAGLGGPPLPLTSFCGLTVPGIFLRIGRGRLRSRIFSSASLGGPSIPPVLIRRLADNIPFVQSSPCRIIGDRPKGDGRKGVWQLWLCWPGA